MYLYCFTFHPTPATEIYTLSLHDALPISCLPPSLRFGRGVEALDRPALRVRRVGGAARRGRQRGEGAAGARGIAGVARLGTRSEEHTSELQSHSDLVCRLLLEKKNEKANT